MKPKKDTVITIGILLLIILLSSYMLYGEIYRKSKSSNEKIIGKVTFKEKTVQRKFNISAVWDEIENEVPVANRDTIRTMDFADAVLTLNDNTKIKLSDNSMIFLEFEEKKLNINFEQGAIAAESGDDENTKISFKSGDKVVEMGQGSTKISKNEDDNIDVSVEKGSALIKMNGQEQKVEKNQTAELKNTKIEIKPLRFQLLSPFDSKFFSTQSEKLDIEFKWEPVEKVTDFKLELANDKGFKVNPKSFLIQRDLFKIMKLDVGNYFWRLAAKNIIGGKQEYSEIRKFRIVSDSPIKITNPPDGKVFQYSGKLPVIPIGWLKNENSTSYKLEVATNQEFSKVLKSNDLFQTSTSIEVPSKGFYFLRVTTKPSLPDLLPSTTSIVKFSVEEKTLPTPPELISPSPNSSFSSEFFQKGKVSFSWRDNREFEKFEIEISKSSEFLNSIVKQTVQGNYLLPTFSEKPGELFYRVRGILSDGRKSEFSKVVLFRISEPENLKLLYPENSAEIEMSANRDINFKWQRSDASSDFILEVSKDKAFTNLSYPTPNPADSEIIRGFNRTVILNTEGIYYWRVKLISKDKTEISKSEVFSFNILAPPLAKLINPPNGSQINLNSATEINFTWEKNSAAISYDLEIQDISQSNGRVILKTTLNDGSFSMNDVQKFKDGNYSWGVALNYLKKDGKPGKSPLSKSTFRTQVPKVDPPIPKPIYPANGAELVLETEEILFNWEKNDKAVYYQIDLQEKNSKRAKPIFQKQSADLNTLFVIPNTISEGMYQYELSIFYKTWDGKVIKSPPVKYEFSMKLPLRTPPLPVLKSPINGIEVKPDDKWQILLDWDANPRANSYQVTVKSALTNKIHFQETTLKNSAIFLVSDSAIKPGSYKWSVFLNYQTKEGKNLKSPFKTADFNLQIQKQEVPIPEPILPEAKKGFNPLASKEILFTWEKKEIATSFYWELYENLDEKSRPILEKEVFGLSYPLIDLEKYKDGIYYWKLYANYKDRSGKVIRGEPIVNEFSIVTPVEDKTAAPEILNNPRLYVE